MHLAESVVIVIYTWEEYVGNRSNFFLLQVGSSETTREAPCYIYMLRKHKCITMGEYIVQPGRKLLHPNKEMV